MLLRPVRNSSRAVVFQPQVSQLYYCSLFTSSAGSPQLRQIDLSFLRAFFQAGSFQSALARPSVYSFNTARKRFPNSEALTRRRAPIVENSSDCD
jgi:hypothetical protein